MFTTYRIINLITNQYYIGSHKTLDINDDYMGSGVLIKESIEKFGVENHYKEILGSFGTREESIALEHQLIREAKKLKDPLLLNKSSGGLSFDFINDNLKFDRKAFGKLASHEHAHELRKQNIVNYNCNPKLCQYCGKPLPYDKRCNRFCNSSCSASYNNSHRISKTIIKCELCEKTFKAGHSAQRFCSNQCSSKYRELNRKCSDLKLRLLLDKDIILKRHAVESYNKIAKDYNCSSNMIKELCKGRLG